MTAQIILSLSILVGIHELGHMVTAKWFGMRVEQFSIGFPPKIFGFKKGETEYSIGSIPLGGFVKISGMVDESLDTEKLGEEPKPWEFRSKPAWQRLIVMLGGVTMNVIIGILIFIIITFIYGDPYVPKDEVNKYGIVAYELGEKIGLQTGDKILQVNGHDYKRFSDLTGSNVLLESNSFYTIERNGETMRIDIPNNFIEEFSDIDAQLFMEPRAFSKIVDIVKDGNAAKSNLQKGDIITMVNGDTTFSHELNEKIKKNAGKEINLTVQRPLKEEDKAENFTTQQINASVGADSLLGIQHGSDIDFNYINYSFGQSIGEGTEKAFEAVWVNIKAFGKIIRGEISATESLSGPIGIARVFGGNWDWLRFWRLTGLLSMVLAFMNLLPIPALDGGHVMFLLYEIISGRKPSDKFMETAQKIGMAILLALMVFVIFNDILKLPFLQNLF